MIIFYDERNILEPKELNNAISSSLFINEEFKQISIHMKVDTYTDILAYQQN